MSHIFAPDSSPLRRASKGEEQPNGAANNMQRSHANGSHGTHVKSRLGMQNSKLDFTRTEFVSRSASPEEARRGTTNQAGPSRPLSDLARSVNARSQNALAAAAPQSSARRSRTRSQDSDLSSESDAGSNSHKRFKSSLQQFQYDGPGASNTKSTSIDEAASSLSDLSPDEGLLGEMLGNKTSDKPKKKRFVRAQPVDASPDAKVIAKDSGRAHSAADPPIPVKQSNASVAADDDGLHATAKRMQRIRPMIELEDAKQALLECSRNIPEALKLIDQKRAKSGAKATVRVIPESPSSASSPTPVKRIANVDLTFSSPTPTKSLIAGKARVTGPLKGVQVTKKKVAVPVYRNSASPVPSMRNGDSKSSALRTSSSSKDALLRVKGGIRKAHSAPTSDNDPDSYSVDDASDGDDSDDGGDYDYKRTSERKALQWFNQSDEKKLIDFVTVTPAQAQTIIELRPFSSTDDLTSKLNAAKGVQPKIFYNCVELVSGLQQIDAVLEKCEKMGRTLSDALGKWGTDGGGDAAYLRKQPDGAEDTVVLHDFQMYGVNWLNLLYRKKCSGILADDMGLGKTAQVISFLNHIVHQQRAGPHLIVVPSSVLTNWLREFATFGPDLSVFKYHGSQKERVEQQMELKSAREDYDVVLTTYDMAAGADRDHNFLRKYTFDAVIFDEGHILKNQKSVKYAKLTRIRASWRLLLTGTPLQNNLGELISLLNFIMPSYFRGAEEALSQIFQVKQQTQLSRERVRRAKKMMRPFVLRRKKIDVLHTLKSKTEQIKYCDMTAEQASIYRNAFAKTRAALLEQQEYEAAAVREGQTATRRKKSDMPAAIKSGHILMELRKAANHPLLFRRLYNDKKLDALARDYLKVAEHATEDLQEKREDFAINSDAELCMAIAMQYPECKKHELPSKEWLNSGKMAALKEVIDEATQRGERLIIFSQFVQTLEIVCRALEVMNVTYRGFTGSTDVNSRQHLVDEFTEDKSISCFLLSTRAGGVGINLTAASWVVFYDNDFNPQNDQQAADRCYRIGQEKAVTIVRLISRGTIDERIYELGRSKLKLADRVQGEDEDDSNDEGELTGANDQEAMEKKVEQTLLAGILEGEDGIA